MFSLTDGEYRRWLELEAEENRTPAAEAELRGYLDAIAASEDQVRQWVLDYLWAGPHRAKGCGADRAALYRAVAPRLPAAWGARMVARVHGACRHRDDVFAGKMLILDEALLALCWSGQVETLCDPVGDTTFRLSSDPEATVRRREQAHARAGRPDAGRTRGLAPAEGPTDCSSPAGARPDLRALLASLGAFVGFDE